MDKVVDLKLKGSKCSLSKIGAQPFPQQNSMFSLLEEA